VNPIADQLAKRLMHHPLALDSRFAREGGALNEE
jgi:hypothetical protein